MTARRQLMTQSGHGAEAIWKAEGQITEKVQSLLCAVLRTFPASPQRIADFGPTGHKSHRGHLARLPAAIFGLADLSSQSERDDVSTYRKAQKYNRETPKQSSTLSLSNSATRIMSLLRAGQNTYSILHKGKPWALCTNQGWPRHRPDKLANTRQNPALLSLAYNGSPRS